MSKHLSHDQFARCFLSKPGDAEQQHLNDCRQCRIELDRFGATISSFRTAIRDRVDLEVSTSISAFATPRRAAPLSAFVLRWSFIAASVLAFVMVPFLAREQKTRVIMNQPSTAEDTNALMDAVNRHLSRTMPAPMEPVIALLPTNERVTESGGVQ
jgi:hypothetical protein